MCTNVPVLRKCCCCLPLRHGLIVWGYIKMIMLFLTLPYLFMTILFSLRAVSSHRFRDLGILATIIFLLTIDITLHIIFVIGAHKKNVKLLKAYYFYSITTLVLLSLLTFVYMIASEFYPSQSMLYIMACAIYLVLQAYIILLVRSEIIKLKDSATCKFVNNVVDAECVLNVKNTNEEKDTSIDYNSKDLSKDNYEYTPIK